MTFVERVLLEKIAELIKRLTKRAHSTAGAAAAAPDSPSAAAAGAGGAAGKRKKGRR
jgi:hypothetical protein